MDQAIRALLAVDTGLDSRDLSDLLPTNDAVRLAAVTEGLDEGWQTLQETPVDILIVACLGYSDRALFLIDRARKLNAQLSVLVLSQGSPNGFVRRVFEAGADDILTLPQTSEQIGFAIQKLSARRTQSGTASGLDLGRLVCVLGPKGGTGKTLTSTNLAIALQQGGQRSLLIDLDLQFGDVALSMGVPPETTIHDLALSGGTLDATKLDDFVAEHPSGVRVLLAPSRPDQASAVTVELLREVYAIARVYFDYVIIDTPPGFTAEVIASIDTSTDLVMVGMLDSLSLKNTKLGLETLELMGYRADKIHLVLNRAHSKVGITTSDVVTVLGREPDVFVPSDREIPRTINEGTPIVEAKPQSEAAGAFRSLARILAGDDLTTLTEPAQAEPRRRLFSRKA